MMEERERLARLLCKHHGVDPDAIGYAQTNLGKIVGEQYRLWEYWATHYVDVILGEKND